MIGVDVIVCVCFNEPSGGSEMLTRVCRYPVAPNIDDYIEITPARKDERRDLSAWHERVARRYLHVTESDPRIEVHIELPRRELDNEGRVSLIEAGYK